MSEEETKVTGEMKRALQTYYDLVALAREQQVQLRMSNGSLSRDEAIDELGRKGFAPGFEGFLLNVAFELWKRGL
jgi:hypothetical protein